MATATLKPTSTISNDPDWDIVVAATAHEAIDEGVDTPITYDRIQCGAAGRIVTFGFEDLSGVPGEIATSNIRVRFHYSGTTVIEAPTNVLTLKYGDDSEIASPRLSWEHSVATGYYDFENVVMTKEALNNIRLTITSDNYEVGDGEPKFEQ